MASFSFGAGNAQKLLRIPLYVLGRVVTLVIPRRRGHWVFGCGAGIGDGALALWQVARAQQHPAVWLVGSPREAADARALGIPHLEKHSLRGLWMTARAEVIVITHGFGDVNRYAVSGAVIVQLWHGIPLKRIGLDSAETVRSSFLPSSTLVRWLLATAYRRATRRIGVLPAASHLVRGRLESAFSLPDERVPVTGEPRVDVLSQGDAPARAVAATALVEGIIGALPQNARLTLYAPTWRDGEPDPAVPSAEQWREITELLNRHNAVLLVRSHPLGAGSYVPPVQSDRVRALGSDVLPDVTPALPALHTLITDYSSLAFDAALVPLPVLYLAPDESAYAARRGFYGAYSDVASTDYAQTWSELVGQWNAVLSDVDAYEQLEQRSRALSERVHAFRDGGNTHRVYRAIMARVGNAADAVTRTAKGPR